MSAMQDAGSPGHEGWGFIDAIGSNLSDLEVGGTQSTLDLASALCGEYARLVIAGYHQDGLRQVNMQQWNWRGIHVVNAHERATEYTVDSMAAAYAKVYRSLATTVPHTRQPSGARAVA